MRRALGAALALALVLAAWLLVRTPAGERLRTALGDRGRAYVRAALFDERGVARLFGPICRWTVPAPEGGGYLGAIGMSIVRLEPRPGGVLERTVEHPLGVSPHGGAIVGTRLYVAGGDRGLVTYDASDRHHLRLVAQAREGGYALAIAHVRGHLVLAYKERGGVSVFRIEPGDAPPTFVARLLDGQSFGNLRVEGDLAYVVGSERLVILDVRDPGRTAVLSELPMPAYEATPRPTDPMPRRVALHGRHAYLAHGAYGLYVADVADPRQPRLLGTVPGIDFCDWVEVRGDALYAASEATPVQVADVGADPAHPRWLGPLLPPADGTTGGAGATNGPAHGGGFEPPGDAVPADALVTLSLGPRGIFELDARDPLAPVVRHAYVPPAFRHRVRVIGDQAHVGAGAAGVETYSLADPAAPRLVGRLDTEGIARSLLPVGDQLWVGDVLGWLLLTRPRPDGAPEVVDVADRGGHAWSVAVDEDLVYVANSQVGFATFERTPRGLVVYGEATTGHYSINVAGWAGHAYVGTIGHGVTVFRADRQPPLELRSLSWGTVGPLPIGPVGLAVTVVPTADAAVLLVGDAEGRLLAYDLADPGAPALRWRKKVGGPVYDVVADADALWVAAGPAGVVKLGRDLATEPAELARVAVAGVAMSTVRAGDRLLVAAGEAPLASLPLP